MSILYHKSPESLRFINQNFSMMPSSVNKFTNNLPCIKKKKLRKEIVNTMQNQMKLPNTSLANSPNQSLHMQISPVAQALQHPMSSKNSMQSHYSNFNQNRYMSHRSNLSSREHNDVPKAPHYMVSRKHNIKKVKLDSLNYLSQTSSQVHPNNPSETLSSIVCNVNRKVDISPTSKNLSAQRRSPLLVEELENSTKRGSHYGSISSVRERRSGVSSNLIYLF